MLIDYRLSLRKRYVKLKPTIHTHPTSLSKQKKSVEVINIEETNKDKCPVSARQLTPNSLNLPTGRMVGLRKNRK